MVAKVCKAVVQKQNREAALEREEVAVARVKEWVATAYEPQTKQTFKAILFPSYGWVPKTACGWMKPDGTVLPWSGTTSDGDVFVIAAWVVEKQKIQVKSPVPVKRPKYNPETDEWE